MKIMELTLRAFKKSLKPWLEEKDFAHFKVITCRKTFCYKAEIVDDKLMVTVPGKRIEDDRFLQISQLSLKRRKHTVTVFIEKRISILSTAI